jgi:hypothetical protein
MTDDYPSRLDYARGYTSGLDSALTAIKSVTQQLIDEDRSEQEREIISKICSGIVMGLTEAIRLIKSVDNQE